MATLTIDMTQRTSHQIVREANIRLEAASRWLDHVTEGDCTAETGIPAALELIANARKMLEEANAS